MSLRERLEQFIKIETRLVVNQDLGRENEENGMRFILGMIRMF